jgi:hypothetical protein
VLRDLERRSEGGGGSMNSQSVVSHRPL